MDWNPVWLWRCLFLIFLCNLCLSSCFDLHFRDKMLSGRIRSAPSHDRPEHFKLTILHTNDLHSQFVGMGPDALFTDRVDGDPVQGGFARLAYEIRRLRSEKQKLGEPVLVVDSGDFFAGSLFHVIGPSTKSRRVPELEFFSLVGYDALVLGNHEFDAGERGLMNMLQKAEALQLNLPFVISNAKKPSDSPLLHYDRDTTSGVRITSLMRKTLWNRKRSLGVCIFGALGPNAAFASSVNRQDTAFYGFDDVASRENTDELVSHLRGILSEAQVREKCQFNVLLVHAGSPEDEILAREIKGLDVVISGHTHQRYVKDIGGTIVAQTGSHGAFLGHLEIEVKGQQTLLRTSSDVYPVDDLVFQPINDSIPADPEVAVLVEDAKREISRVMGEGYDWGEPLLQVEQDLPHDREYPNNPLGGLLLGRLLDQVNECLVDQGESDLAHLYFSVVSLFRNSFKRGGLKSVIYQLSDIFKFFSIGFTPDLRPGSPVMTFYLQKQEVKELVEFFEVYRFVNPLGLPAFSANFTYQLRSWGVPLLNRVKDLQWNGQDWEQAPDLVRLASNSLIVSYLGEITQLSRGLVSLRSRDKSGNFAPPSPLPCDKREHDLLISSYRNDLKGLPLLPN